MIDIVGNRVKEKKYVEGKQVRRTRKRKMRKGSTRGGQGEERCRKGSSARRFGETDDQNLGSKC